MDNILFLCSVFIKFHIENALSQVAALTHYILAILAKITKFSCLTFKVIISHKSLKCFDNQYVVICVPKEKIKNIILITMEFIKRGILLLNSHSIPYGVHNTSKLATSQLEYFLDTTAYWSDPTFKKHLYDCS